jgi:hypothetical protein
MEGRMKNLPFEKDSLLPGTIAYRMEPNDETLRLPAEGGGISIPGLINSSERFLVFLLEVQEEHSMAFELQFFGEGDAMKPRFLLRFGIMPRVPARICADMEWLEGGILFPGHTPGMLKAVCHGSRIGREQIVRVLLVGRDCHHPVMARVSGMALTDERPEPYPLPDIRFIDALGQYKLKDWPGKILSEAELKDKVLRQAALPDAYPVPGWDRFGGCADMKICKATGFFSKAKVDGRWHLTDPEGNAFFSLGMDCVISDPDCRVDGVEKLLDWLPATDDPVYASAYKQPRHFGRGYLDAVPRGEPVIFSYTRANLIRALGGNGHAAWAGMIPRQLKNAGINTLGNWSDPALFGAGMPYVAMLGSFPETDTLIFRDFPDVFSPQYAQRARECARSLRERAGDPWMIGYFLRNEPGWAFVDGLVIADEVLRNPAPSCCRDRLVYWLHQKYAGIAALNAAWHTEYADFDDLGGPIHNASSLSAQAREDLREFSRMMLEAYAAIPAAACRAEDPNHMNLGMRWAWISDPDIVTGWKHFDVFSINCYAVDPTAALNHVRVLGVDLPVMIGEYHFGALDRGLTATGLEGVASQGDRAAAYRHYCEKAAAHPACVGCHYFQCYDQFALGRFDGENYNIGLFDTCLQPYPEMAKASLKSAGRIYAVRLGAPPYRRKPVRIPMIAY